MRLVGLRKGKSRTFEVGFGAWNSMVRPQMPRDVEQAYLQGKQQLESGESTDDVALWRRILETAPNQQSRSLRCWLAYSIAATLDRAGRLKRSEAFHEKALTECTTAREQSAVLGFRASRLERRGDLSGAAAILRRVLEIRRKSPRYQLGAANTQSGLGTLAWASGQLESADQLCREAYEVESRQAPGSWALALTLSRLGNVAATRGDLDRAWEHFESARRIVLPAAPRSSMAAGILNNLGGIAAIKGEYALTVEHLGQVLAIQEAASADALDIARTLFNLGFVAYQQGDFSQSERFHRRALKIRRSVAKRRPDVANSLVQLGNIASNRGDLEAAEGLYREALDIHAGAAPESLQTAVCLSSLGYLAFEQGRLQESRRFHLLALEARQKTTPRGADVSISLFDLGQVALALGELDRAGERFEQALLHQSAIAPESHMAAKIHHWLGRLHEEREQPVQAAAAYSRALEALERQVYALGGSQDVKADFRAQHQPFYRRYMDLLATMDQPAQAFAVLERSRARGFLNMVAEKTALRSAQLPPDLEKARQKLVSRYSDLQRELTKATTDSQKDSLDQLEQRLGDLRWRMDQLMEEMRRRVPRLAALRYPRTLDFEAARSALDPGTAMLSYSVGGKDTWLFLLRRETPLIALKLPLGRSDLRSRIEEFRSLIQQARPGSQLGIGRQQQLVPAARRLYDALIAPVEDVLDSSRRIAILADGPLQVLPFDALIRRSAKPSSDPNDDVEYLIEWKPIHWVASATVFADLRSNRPGASGPGRRGDGATELAAFGDPAYPSSPDLNLDDPVGSPRVRSALRRGFRFRPLPSTRREVKGIAALFSRNASVFLGEDANEENLKALPPETRYLHVAAHGFLDHRFPMNSALALAILQDGTTQSEDGLLQVWEIFESVRIEADLVVLSACDSGLGTELAGEGLNGLTRAFQFAGAQSVVASLWEVADDATATFMIRFYEFLKSGRSKDEALRRAKIELIRGRAHSNGRAALGGESGDASSPYFWSSIQLFGDWR